MKKYETLVEPRLKEIGDWARDGHTEKDISAALGLSYSSFRNYKKEHQELAGVLTENKFKADLLVLGNLFKTANGYEAKEITKELINGELKITKEVTKHIGPNPQSVQFWLTNRQPEIWKNKQTTDGTIDVKAKLEDFIK